MQGLSYLIFFGKSCDMYCIYLNLRWGFFSLQSAWREKVLILDSCTKLGRGEGGDCCGPEPGLEQESDLQQLPLPLPLVPFSFYPPPCLLPLLTIQPEPWLRSRSSYIPSWVWRTLEALLPAWRISSANTGRGCASMCCASGRNRARAASDCKGGGEGANTVGSRAEGTETVRSRE